MVRACHRDTCPTGIATQRPNLRAKFAGTPEGVATYMLFVAEEVRRTLASLGLRTLDEAIGRVDLLRQRSTGDARADTLDLVAAARRRRRRTGRRHFVADGADPAAALGARRAAARRRASPRCGTATTSSSSTRSPTPTAPSARRSAARSGSSGARRLPPGLGDGALHRLGRARASARSSPTASRSSCVGEANDYLGKGMGGGRVIVRPPDGDAGDPVLAGNTVLYGATGGQVFVAGRVGERFCVRNSGATAVVEGTGDHACEYMTGGTVRRSSARSATTSAPA